MPTLKQLAAALTVSISLIGGVAGLHIWYKSVPELTFELQFVTSDPEEFRCTEGFNSVQSKGSWVILVKNLSTSPIVVDSLDVVTWHARGGTVVSVDQRNPVGYTHRGPDFLRIESFRVDAGGFEKLVKVDWFPESSNRTALFIKKQGCIRPYSWRQFKDRASGFADLKNDANMTITINVRYGQGKSKYIFAKKSDQYQAWVTPSMKLFSF